MKNLLSLFALFFSVVCSSAQVPGCTDSNACNYDPLATIDDGSCTDSFYCNDLISGHNQVVSYELVGTCGASHEIWIPDYSECPSSEVNVVGSSTTLDEGPDMYMLSTPSAECGFWDEAWDFNFSDIPGNYGIDEYYHLESGYMIRGLDGNIILFADIYSNDNPNNGWNIQISMTNELNYNDWLNQSFPTGIKSDCFDSEGYHQDWLYYIVSSESVMYGLGNYEGSYLNLSHSPSNQYFAAQFGERANNVDTSFGVGSWITAEGYFQNSENNLTDGGVEVFAAGGFAYQCNLINYPEDLCGSLNYYIIISTNVCGDFKNTLGFYIESCLGCLDPLAANYDPNANCAGFCDYYCYGDANGDYSIDILDLLTISGEFGFDCDADEVGCLGDANFDGTVDVLDILMVSSAFGNPCAIE